MTDLFPLVWYITGFITKVSADITTNRDSYLFPGWQTGAGLQSLSGGYGSLTGSRDDCEFVSYAVTVSLTKSIEKFAIISAKQGNLHQSGISQRTCRLDGLHYKMP